MNHDDYGQAPLAGGRSNSLDEFLQRAAHAASAGDGELAIHLYLAAFEDDLTTNVVPTEAALMGMQKAWDLALEGKQRSLAEYIFEKLEPYWDDQEASHHADELQRLAFDKLEEIGFPVEMFEGIDKMISDELDVSRPWEAAETQESPAAAFGFAPADGELADLLAKRAEERGGVVEEPTPEAAPVAEGADGLPSDDALRSTQDLIRRAVQQNLRPEAPEPEHVQAIPVEPAADQAPAPAPSKTPIVRMSKIVIPEKKKQQQAPAPAPNWFDFRSLCGFDSVIEKMHRLGVGRGHDLGYRNFVQMLNQRHGVSAPPSLGTLMFACDAREDANCLMVATVGELRVPAVRMRFDRNAAGQSVLVLMSSPDFKSRISNIARSGFEGPAAVVLEDLDLWTVPELDPPAEEMNMGTLMQMQVSRGAREALGLIQAALDHPEVTVLLSASNVDAIDPYFLELIGPFRTIGIDLPDASERRAIWRRAQAEHPSLRGLDVEQLVGFSRNMSRFEIWAIANEAVDEAYRSSLALGRFCAVRTDDVLMRLSNFQPLDSQEYRDMEDLVVGAFAHDLDQTLDALLGGN